MKKQLKSSQYLTSLNLVCFAQALVPTIFAVVVYTLHDPTLETDKEQAALFQYLVIGALIVGLTAAQILPKMLLKNISPTLPLKHKIPKYFQTTIIRYALLEVPALVACVAAFITGKLILLVAVPLLLILFYLYRPTKEAIATDLNLTQQERDTLNDPNAIIAEVDQSYTSD